MVRGSCKGFFIGLWAGLGDFKEFREAGLSASKEQGQLGLGGPCYVLSKRQKAVWLALSV